MAILTCTVLSLICVFAAIVPFKWGQEVQRSLFGVYNQTLVIVTNVSAGPTLMSGAGGAGSGRGAVNPWLVNESEETRGPEFRTDQGAAAQHHGRSVGLCWAPAGP